MMNDVSFLEVLWITCQVVIKVAINFAPVIVLGLAFATYLKAREVLFKSKKPTWNVQKLTREDLRWQAHLAEQQTKQMLEKQK